MIQLQRLINEKIETKVVDWEDAKALLTTKYRFSFWLFHNDMEFWRGHRLHDFKQSYLEVFPSKGERESVDSANIYTVLLGHLPSWKGWPKRSNALIMSTDSNDAGDYGNHLMMVFPANDAKLVASGYRDVLADRAFPFMSRKFDIGISTIGNLDDILELLARDDASGWKGKYKSTIGGLTAGEYEMFMNDLQSHTTVKKIATLLKEFKEQMAKGSYISMYQTGVVKVLQAFVKTRKVHGWNWEKFLDYLLDPEKNHFELLSLEDYKGTVHRAGSYELWTDADCLLVTDRAGMDLKKFSKEVFANGYEPN